MGVALKERIQEYMKRYAMAAPGDVICVGCSGGADSVFLLQMLWEIGTEAENAVGKERFRVSACHVNHNLRGRESDKDEAFVRRFCEERGIPLAVYSPDVRALAAEQKTGLEEAGRAARQEAFRDCLLRHGATRIALAHHADDQAETVLYHMARGSALSGMAGIRPVSGKIIRPLLFLSKEEITSELTRRGISWRTDCSNRSDEFARNRLRHRVLPELEEEIHGGAVRHIGECAESARLADEFIAGEAERRASSYVFHPEGKDGAKSVGIREEIRHEPLIIRRYILMSCLEELAGRKKDIGKIHLDETLSLLEKGAGKRVCLPYGITAARKYGAVVLEKNAKIAPHENEKNESPRELLITGSGRWHLFGATISAEILTSPEEIRKIRKSFSDLRSEDFSRKKGTPVYCQEEPDLPGSAEMGRKPASIVQKTYTKVLDYDKMEPNLTVRSRRPGDFIVINEAGQHQKLKDYLINEKIPAEQRDDLILFVSGQRVLWAVGGRIGEDVKITQETSRIIRLTVTPD